MHVLCVQRCGSPTQTTTFPHNHSSAQIPSQTNPHPDKPLSHANIHSRREKQSCMLAYVQGYGLTETCAASPIAKLHPRHPCVCLPNYTFT
eukprot:155499-Chlamydomonas_euryale.AAC.2